MRTRQAGSARGVKRGIRRRLAAAGGSAVLAVAVAAPAAEAALGTQRDRETLQPAVPLSARALAARESLVAPSPPNAAPASPIELAWWGNWHNWGWHPWWHNWPNWRNWNNWGNGPGMFAGCG